MRDILTDTRPDVILFPAAMPDVEWCEAHEAQAREANLAPLRAVLAGSRKPVIAFSSDYVFDGTAGPYAEDAPRHPLSVYGHIKADVAVRGPASDLLLVLSRRRPLDAAPTLQLQGDRALLDHWIDHMDWVNNG